MRCYPKADLQNVADIADIICAKLLCSAKFVMIFPLFSTKFVSIYALFSKKFGFVAIYAFFSTKFVTIYTLFL